MGDTRTSAERQYAFVAVIAVAVVLAVLFLLSLLVIIILVMWGTRLSKQKRIILAGIHESCASNAIAMNGLVTFPCILAVQSQKHTMVSPGVEIPVDDQIKSPSANSTTAFLQ